ncbi:unnamed protein product [Dimorphilus gyrociliatus]|uniref:Uncharacterized protein n=1 Tax=Dimorphilus gyrociliatus TaxID=2664684 RepID=A0A7I8W967_9ANNE|nr:unnamed protein product [Dimorphilus gyrociliatus]
MKLESFYLNARVNLCEFKFNFCKETLKTVYLNVNCQSFSISEDLNQLKSLAIRSKSKRISLTSINLPQRKKLKELSCRFCGLENLEMNFSSIEKLDLSFNKFQSIPNISGNNLKSLNLSYNAITTFSVPRTLTHLETLDLSNNELSNMAQSSHVTELLRRNQSGLININLNKNRLLCNCDMNYMIVGYQLLNRKSTDSFYGKCNFNGQDYSTSIKLNAITKYNKVDKSTFEIKSTKDKSDSTLISCMVKGCSRYAVVNFTFFRYSFQNRFKKYLKRSYRMPYIEIRNSTGFVERKYKCSELHKTDYFECVFSTKNQTFRASTKKISCFSHDDQQQNQLLTFIIPVSVGTLVVFGLIVVCSVSKKVYTRSRLKKFIIMLKIGRLSHPEPEIEAEVSERQNSDSEPPEYHSEDGREIPTVSQTCPRVTLDVIKPPSYETVQFYMNSSPPAYSSVSN